MSTGHCWTHAPQLVQDQSTSGSTTPTAPSGPTRIGSPSAWAYASAPAPTSGRSASCRTASGSSPRADSAACSQGALAYACSRNPIISSFGESGFSVFQAGHCDWHRPHSVQEVKSSRPFQAKSSIRPTPSRSCCSSVRSSTSSSPPTGLPSMLIGSIAPSAVPPSLLRLNQMFGQAVNRCQATPIVRFSPITQNQAIEMMIFSAATQTIAVSRASTDSPLGAIQNVSGKWNGVPCAEPVATARAYSSARSARMQSAIPRMVNST